MRFYQNENGLEIDLIMDFDSNYKFCFKIVSDVAQAKADLMAFRKQNLLNWTLLWEQKLVLVVITSFDEQSNYYDGLNQICFINASKIKP